MLGKVICLMELACMQEIIGGISNGGYWGMSVQAGKNYFFSAYAADPSLASAAGNNSNIGVSMPPYHAP